MSLDEWNMFIDRFSQDKKNLDKFKKKFSAPEIIALRRNGVRVTLLWNPEVADPSFYDLCRCIRGVLKRLIDNPRQDDGQCSRWFPGIRYIVSSSQL
jgi:hypothetical protein